MARQDTPWLLAEFDRVGDLPQFAVAPAALSVVTVMTGMLEGPWTYAWRAVVGGPSCLAWQRVGDVHNGAFAEGRQGVVPWVPPSWVTPPFSCGISWLGWRGGRYDDHDVGVAGDGAGHHVDEPEDDTKSPFLADAQLAIAGQWVPGPGPESSATGCPDGRAFRGLIDSTNATADSASSPYTREAKAPQLAYLAYSKELSVIPITLRSS